MAEVLKDHIERCPEHPLSEAVARIGWLEDCAEEALEFLGVDGDVRATLRVLRLMQPKEET